MKLSLEQKTWLAAGVVGLGILTALIGSRSALLSVGLLLIIAGCILDIVWMRCPSCGEWLGKRPGKYCKHCGEKIDWVAK